MHEALFKPDKRVLSRMHQWLAASLGGVRSAAKTSVVTSKPAIEGHFKTGQRTEPGQDPFIPLRIHLASFCHVFFLASFFRSARRILS